MKRYIAFVFQSYEEGGGWNDVLQDEDEKALSFDTVREAVNGVFRKIDDDRRFALCDQIIIVDVEEGKVAQSIWREDYAPGRWSGPEELWFDIKRSVFIDTEGQIVRDKHFDLIESKPA